MKQLTILKPQTEATPNGGKANNLLMMEQMALNVPQWVLVPKEIMSAQLAQLLSIYNRAEALCQLKVPSHLFTQFDTYFGKDYRQLSYAVRSSGTSEDGAAHSFAGQYETVLNVSYDDLSSAVLQVWQSIDSPQLQRYRDLHDLQSEMGIAVIIQVMVPSEVSGVAFGMNPVSGDDSQKVIAAVPGLGEGLVSGQLNADNFTISKDGINAQTQYKEGTLNEEQLMEISELLDSLNAHTGVAQDVEFAYADGQLYVLQTRPITTLGDQMRSEYLVWDNSNIIESYPGVTTPMTYSFITRMYAAVYIQLCELLGVSKKVIRENDEVFQNTLGLVRGRVYYNLRSWYQMLAMVPGYSWNASFMETMMGVKETFELDDKNKMSRAKAGFRIVLMLFRMLWLNVTLGRSRDKFQQYIENKISQYNAINYDNLSIQKTLSHYKQYETTLLKEWKVPLVNDFFSMIWFGLLKRQTEGLVPEEINIHNDLLCGSRDIISVEPIRRTMAIAKLIISREQSRKLFIKESPYIILIELNKEENETIKESIDNYLRDFGERCIGELKLETTSYTQNPSLFIMILKHYVTNNITPDVNGGDMDTALRKQAEQKVFVQLKFKPIKRLWFSFVLGRARALVSNRENLRYERTRAFGIVRKMISGIDAQLVEKKILTNHKDVFYLDLESILNYSENNSTQLANQIRTNKAKFDAYAMQPDPKERFYTYGYQFEDTFIYSDEKVEAIEGDLQGIGCCPGQIKAKVSVVMDPTNVDSLNGDILVTRSTDPGWVTLFPSASAIIVERGSLLSHSAIVAREMGIPCIVSVDGLLRTVKTGDEILMDGSTGRIKILQTKSQSYD